jgi:predicted peptidase
MCSLGAALRDSALDRVLWPALKRSSLYMPTYSVGGTECMVITRDDATSWVLYCHGNAVTLADLHMSGIPAAIVHNCRCNFVAPAYPERYSAGKVYDETVVTAVRNAYEKIKVDTASPVYVMGRSIGVGVALRACVQQPPAGLGLISGFSSIKHMAPWMLRWIVDNRFDNVMAIENLKDTRKLIVHGADDELVPVDNANTLAQHGGEFCDLEIVPSMTHVPQPCDIALIARKMAEMMQADSGIVPRHHYSLWCK